MNVDQSSPRSVKYVAFMAAQSQPEPDKFAHSVRHLTRLSSQGDYVVVDKEAPYVLKSATRIRKAQSPYGVFYEAYHSAKSKAKSLLSRPSQSTGAAASVDERSTCTDPYDTSNWDDKQSDRQHYITAENVAALVQSEISILYTSIRGHTYVVHKFKIYQTQDENGHLARDYFLQILVDAPPIQYIFAYVRVTGPVGLPHATLIHTPCYPHAQ